MKKLLTTIVAVVILAALTVPAFAQTMSKGDKDIDVNAKYVNGETTPDVYNVDVSWGTMEFTYTQAGTKVWNPETHTYSNSTQAVWSENGNTVTVVNHSNKEVATKFEYSKVVDTVEGKFDVAQKTLNAGVENEPTSADKVVATLKLSGTISNTELTKVGSVKVTIE